MSSDIKQSTETKEGTLTSSQQEKSSSAFAPPLPVLQDDDMDDDDENFPLITSVFSLASSDNDSTDTAESPRKTPSPGKFKDATLQKEPFSTMKSGVTSPEVKAIHTSSSSTVSSSYSQVNGPLNVGKGNVLLTKAEEMKAKFPQAPGITLNKMVSVTPMTTRATNTTSTRLTRSALKKAEAGTSSSQVTESEALKASTSSQAHGRAVSSNLTSRTLNGNKASTYISTNNLTSHTQIAVPQTNGIAVNLQQTTKQQVSITAPLMKTIVQKPITTPVGTAAVQKPMVYPVLQNPVRAPVKPLGAQILQNPAITPVTMPVASTGRPALAKPRHVNIAPAPLPHSSTPQFVIVPKTATSTTSTTSQVTVSNPATGNARVVMVPKQSSPTPGQLMYLIENKTADGKTFRFLIPTDSAKIVTSPTAGTQTSKVTPRPLQTTQATSPTQVLRIIPKVAGVTASVSKTTTPVASKVSTAQSSVTATVSTSTVPVKTSTSAILKTATPPSTEGSITPPVATSPTMNVADMTSPIPEEDSMNTPPDSPSTVEEPLPKAESIDTGLSPHEARIQKLKELLRKQEDAVDKLREKRKKEIEDVRMPVTKTDGKDDGGRDSQFAVPLPPKKPRLDSQNKRSKTKETSSQTSKDGFLPNTEDVQFAKLLGLEKVVDKLKAKKMLELKENKISDLN